MLWMHYKLQIIQYMSFKKVRDAHRTENTEDYLEIIADLLNTLNTQTCFQCAFNIHSTLITQHSQSDATQLHFLIESESMLLAKLEAKRL